MPVNLADLLAQAITPQGAEGQVPLLQQGRTRLPPAMQPLTPEQAANDVYEGVPENYFDDPLLNVGRSRFPPGLLEGLGLGAARRR